MRQLHSRPFLRPLPIAMAAGCVALLAAGCTAPAPAATPTAAQLLRSAAAWLRGGHPCTIHGDIVVGPTDRSYNSVSSVSAGNHFSATIIQHEVGAKPFTVPERFVDDGGALYLQSAQALRLAYEGTVPARLAGRWVRFPSWPELSPHAYDERYSQLSHYPGAGGAAVADLLLNTVTVPNQGASCGLLLDQMKTELSPASRVASGKLGGRRVLSFTMSNIFVPLFAVHYRVTVSQAAPIRLLRVTSGSDLLSLGYPAAISPISAPPPAEVVPATQIAALSGRQ
jgi:hypothetical protein